MIRTFRPIPTRDFSFDKRLIFLTGVVFLFGLILIAQLFSLQILSGGKSRLSASRQHNIIRVLPATRGAIFYSDKDEDDLYPLATNRAYNHLFAVPRDIANVDEAMAKILPLIKNFDISEETLRARLSKTGDVYEPLIHKLTDEELQPFLDLHLTGLAFEKENWRYYPENDLAGALVGFVSQDDNGQSQGKYGLESFFNKELGGSDGLIEGDVDPRGRLIQTGKQVQIDPKAGSDLVLTIDRIIQGYACEKLSAQAAKLGATGGEVIIMNPKTGAILAMCSAPSFDPNNYGEVKDISVFLNKSVSAAYEPGSIFKAITMAAAVDAGKVGPDTTYEDRGVIKFGSYAIKNSDLKAHGKQTMTEVLKLSLNTGAIFAEQQLGKDNFLAYVKKFGFGKSTGISLPKEAEANISALDNGSDLSFATASFGQGITVTPLQILTAYAALANGGKMPKPYIVKSVRDSGKTISTWEPQILGQPISLRAATILSGMLVAVVREGHTKRAGVPGYYIAAKTGTAQVAEGGAYGQATIHSVVGYGPVRNPAFAMITKIDHPKAGRFAESTAAPLFGEIAKFVLQYYGIPPDEQ